MGAAQFRIHAFTTNSNAFLRGLGGAQCGTRLPQGFGGIPFSGECFGELFLCGCEFLGGVLG